MLGYALLAGIASGVSGSAVNIRVNTFALAAVISSRDHGLKGHPYAGYASVYNVLAHGGFTSVPEILAKDGFTYPDNLKDYKRLNAALAEARTVDVRGSALVMQGAYDEGNVDYVRAAFALFGEDVSSPYYLYFLIIALSMLLFVAEFSDAYEACALLLACVCGIYSFIPSYLGETPDLLTVASPRFLSTIGLIPLLHLILFMASGRTPWHWLSLPVLLLQSALIAFAFACRSPAAWMLVAIGLAAMFYLARPIMVAVRTRHFPKALAPQALRRGLVALICAATFMGVGAVRAHYFVRSNGVVMDVHALWHNMFLSLAMNPEWDARFAAAYAGLEADALGFYAAAKYAVDHDLPYRTLPSIWIETPESRKFTAEALPFGSWAIYEKLEKAAFFEFARQHPGYVIRDFLVYKPVRLLRDLKLFLDTVRHDLTPGTFALLLLLLLVIGGLAPSRGAAAEPCLDFRVVSWVALYCLAASLGPGLVVYSTSYAIGDTGCLLIACFLILAMWAVQEGVARLRLRLAARQIGASR